MEDGKRDDPVWVLLKHAKGPKPSPFFSRDVVRAVRLINDTPAGIFESLLSFFSRRRWLSTTVAAVAAVALIAFFPQDEHGVINQQITQGTSIESDFFTFDPVSELDEVAYLGQLVAVADLEDLTDEALADLFF